MAFFKLIVAGGLEIFWAYTLARSEGFSHLSWTLATVFLLLISVVLLEQVVADFGVGVTYAVFTGIGTAGTAVIDVFIFQQPMPLMKFLSLALLLGGIVGLKLSAEEVTK